MSQKPIEVILMRQLASTLAMPIFLVDAGGTLVFYNEPAERVLGMRFDETGELPPGEWATLWVPTEGDGSPLAPERLVHGPVGAAPADLGLQERRTDRAAPRRRAETQRQLRRTLRRLFARQPRRTRRRAAGATRNDQACRHREQGGTPCAVRRAGEPEHGRTQPPSGSWRRRAWR